MFKQGEILVCISDGDERFGVIRDHTYECSGVAVSRIGEQNDSIRIVGIGSIWDVRKFRKATTWELIKHRLKNLANPPSNTLKYSEPARWDIPAVGSKIAAVKDTKPARKLEEWEKILDQKMLAVNRGEICRVLLTDYSYVKLEGKAGWWNPDDFHWIKIKRK